MFAASVLLLPFILGVPLLFEMLPVYLNNIFTVVFGLPAAGVNWLVEQISSLF